MNRGSGADLVRRLGVILVGATTLVTGCAGLNGGVVIAPLGGLGGKATDPVAALGNEQQYSGLFDNGFGFGASVILRRPPAGTVSAGDIYLLGGVEYVSFAGRQPIPATLVDTMTTLGFWLDAKTMLPPVGAAGVWKPYVLTGVGITVITETGATTGATWTAMYDTCFKLGMRGKLGIERRTGKVGLYADIGIQVISAPNMAPNAPAGSAEPLIYTPVGAGVTLTF